MAGTVVFSDGFDGDAPTGWHANNATVSTDTTHVLTGTRALRVATPGAAGDEGVDRSIAHPISGASDLISVGPNSTYQLSVWLYGNGNLGTRILLDSHDEDFINLGSQGEL
jgi:hypothetical protein